MAETISHYTIVRKLGSGGMGEVYLAEDARLRRKVALKLLPAAVAGDPVRARRFLQEAHAASALSHPNIGVIYEIGETAEGTPFIAMEYIDGATLDAKIGGKPLPLAEIVDIAIEVAEALDEAHGKGITHRDIKPSNLMITARGHVKVVDFGIAKLDTPGDDDASTRIKTDTGLVLGTVAYMSPEQALGLPVDPRSDLFSLGSVLYEMTTGRIPFQGRSVTETIDQIAHAQPEAIARYNYGAPPELERIIRKLHEKEPANRYQSARELEVDLRNLRRDSITGERVIAAAPAKRRRVVPLAIAGAVLLAAIAAAVLFWPKRAPAARPELRLQQVTFQPGLESEPTLSKDGKFLAYTSDESGNLDINVVPTGGGAAIRITDSDADDAQPSFSPDGSKIAFVSARDHGGRLQLPLGVGLLQTYVYGRGGDVFIVSALGGEPVKLVSDAYFPAWSPDGAEIAYASAHGNRDLWVVGAAGGEPRRLVNDPAFDYHPTWSPDGKWIAYAAVELPAGFSIRVVPAAGGEPRTILSEPTLLMRPVWSADGRTILFSRSADGTTNVWKAAVDPARGAVGSLERVTLGEGNDVYLSGPDAAGRLAFATIKHRSDIWELDVASGALRQVTIETVAEDYPDLSPDGKTLALISSRDGARAVWTASLDGKLLSRVGQGQSPRWSPDGTRLVYFNEQGVVVQHLGELASRSVIEGGGLPEWAMGGRAVIADRGPAGRRTVVMVDMATGAERVILPDLKTASSSAVMSPDGRFILYQADDPSGLRQIWSAPVAGGAARQLTQGLDESSHPRFHPRDPDTIALLENHKNILVRSLSTGATRRLTNLTESNLVIDYPAWSPDGTKIYFSMAKNVGDVFLLENY